MLGRLGRFIHGSAPSQPPFLTLTEKQARVCRDALYFARVNNWPPTDEIFDFSETMAYLHRRLSPQFADDCAKLVSVIDQERARYEAAVRSQLT